MTTVTKKPNPQPNAANLSTFLSSGILDAYSGRENRSSDVTNRITATTASKRLKSEIPNGKYMQTQNP